MVEPAPFSPSLRIVAIGGTVRKGSMTERALEYALRPVKSAGASIDIFDGSYLAALPHYGGAHGVKEAGARLVEAVRGADGIMLAAPGYHGTVSGLVKNALDYLEELSRDERPYLDGRAVGLIATARGDQAAMGTMQTLRGIVHALRGWPTPMGATIRTTPDLFDADGDCTDPRAAAGLETVGRQTLQGALAFARS